MNWPLPRPNPPPCCCPRPLKFPPPFAKGIVVVEDTDFVCTTVEDIVVVYTAQANTMVAIVKLAFSHHFSLSRYP